MNASDVNSVDGAKNNALRLALKSEYSNFANIEGLRLTVVKYLIEELKSPDPYSAVVTSNMPYTLHFLQELDATNESLKFEKTDFDEDGLEENALYWAQCSGANSSVIDYTSYFPDRVFFSHLNLNHRMILWFYISIS